MGDGLRCAGRVPAVGIGGAAAAEGGLGGGEGVARPLLLVVVDAGPEPAGHLHALPLLHLVLDVAGVPGDQRLELPHLRAHLEECLLVLDKLCRVVEGAGPFLAHLAVLLGHGRPPVLALLVRQDAGVAVPLVGLVASLRSPADGRCLRVGAEVRPAGGVVLARRGRGDLGAGRDHADLGDGHGEGARERGRLGGGVGEVLAPGRVGGDAAVVALELWCVWCVVGGVWLEMG